MPVCETAAPGTPCWIDLRTSDPAAATAFYTSLFGWSAETRGQEHGGYVVFSKDGRAIAGMSGSGEGQYPDVWSVYLASQDLGATVQAVAEAGGQLLTEPVRLDGRGSMALFLDPGGAAVGAWQPAAHQGFGLTAEAGAPVWFELATREYEAAVRFYAAAFGWQPEQMSDTDQFRYTLNGPFDRATAGIYDAGEALPEGDPSHWMVYLGAPDTDDAVQRVRELGGSVRRAPWDSPYGRMAQIADPTGAVFAIVAV